MMSFFVRPAHLSDRNIVFEASPSSNTSLLQRLVIPSPGLRPGRAYISTSPAARPHTWTYLSLANARGYTARSVRVILNSSIAVVVVVVGEQATSVGWGSLYTVRLRTRHATRLRPWCDTRAQPFTPLSNTQDTIASYCGLRCHNSFTFSACML